MNRNLHTSGHVVYLINVGLYIQYRRSCVLFHSQVPRLHMLYAAIGAVVYTLVSSLKTLSISEGIGEMYISLEPTCMELTISILTFLAPSYSSENVSFPSSQRSVFWSTITLCWHRPDLYFPLATSWRFHRTKAGGWRLTWCGSSFYCIYSPNLSLLLNKTKNVFVFWRR